MKEKIEAEAISIKSPCSENWDEMSGNEKTRACSHCSENVNDISMMTKDEGERCRPRDNANAKLPAGGGNVLTLAVTYDGNIPPTVQYFQKSLDDCLLGP